LLADRGFYSTLDGDFLIFEDIKDEQVVKINRNLIESNIDVLRIEEDRGNLESIFLDITGKGGSL